MKGDTMRNPIKNLPSADDNRNVADVIRENRVIEYAR